MFIFGIEEVPLNYCKFNKRPYLFGYDYEALAKI